jgi:hypothetical protein
MGQAARTAWARAAALTKYSRIMTPEAELLCKNFLMAYAGAAFSLIYASTDDS